VHTQSGSSTTPLEFARSSELSSVLSPLPAAARISPPGFVAPFGDLEIFWTARAGAAALSSVSAAGAPWRLPLELGSGTSSTKMRRRFWPICPRASWAQQKCGCWPPAQHTREQLGSKKREVKQRSSQRKACLPIGARCVQQPATRQAAATARFFPPAVGRRRLAVGVRQECGLPVEHSGLGFGRSTACSSRHRIAVDYFVR
jgi:hypothetical protein